jgi:hypothetical protein
MLHSRRDWLSPVYRTVKRDRRDDTPQLQPDCRIPITRPFRKRNTEKLRIAWALNDTKSRASGRDGLSRRTADEQASKKATLVRFV